MRRGWALVLVAVLAACGGKKMQQFKAAEQVLKPGVDYYAEIETTKGSMVVDLFESETPVTVNSFVFLAQKKFYEGIVWHRVIPGFMAQTGDPTGSGSGGPGYRFGLETKGNLKFDSKGVLGMARTQDPDSNGSQFFVTFGPTPHLNGQYTVFGKVVAGLEVLDQIAPTEGPKATSARDKIVSVKIVEKPKQ